MTEIVQFAGRFHPLLVHLPIGILLLAGILEVLAWTRRRRHARTGAPRERGAPPLESGASAIVVLGAATAIIAAAAGLMLGATGAYAGDTYAWHLWLGLAVAIAASATAAAAVLRDGRDGHRWRRLYASLLAATILLLTVAGHLGATLAHGEGYLTDHAPTPIRTALLRLARRPLPERSTSSPEEALVYTTLVQPILKSRCVSCHGANKAEGGLRLDTPDGIREGGDDGLVVVAGRAASSELVKRIWLPASHPDVMPPRGHRPPTPAEAAILRWWIEQGASFEQTVGDAELSPDLTPIVEALVGKIDRGPTIPRVTIAPPDPAAIEAARTAGFSVTPIADGMPFLYVHCSSAPRRCDDRRLPLLEPLAPNVLWLDLSGTNLSDDGLAVVGRLRHLTQLHLQRTSITDAGLSHLRTLKQLESLNLYGTRVTDAGLMQLADLQRLRMLYVWQTGVTQNGAARLGASVHGLTIETGEARVARPD